MAKLYLIGLDSVPVWLLKEIAKNKRLDGIRWFVEKSDLRDLESNILPVTASAWLSIYTGMREGELGLYDFMKLSPNYEVELADYDINPSNIVWERLGKKCLIITPAMVTKPSKNKNVDMVTGFPGVYKASSDRVSESMRKAALTNEPDVERKIDEGSITPIQAAKILADSIMCKYEFMKDMISRAKYDFVFLCLTETDRIQHFTLSRKDWKDIQMPIFIAINEVFRSLRAMSEKEDIRIVALSDHGGIATYKKFLINKWLIERGYAVPKNDPHKAALLPESIAQNRLTRHIYSKMPFVIKKGVHKSGIADNFNLFKPTDLDTYNTIAFSATSTNKTIPVWFNDERFVNGLTIKDTSKLRLIKDLKSLKFVVNITDGKKYYGKTNKFVVPDLLVEVMDGYTVKPNEIEGDIIKPVNLNRGGEHIRNGFIATYPRLLKKGKKYNVKDVKAIIEKQFK